MDRTVCTLEVGSGVKGYNNERSDRDLIHFVKSSNSSYVRHFTGLRNLLRNRRLDNDTVRANLLTGLVGVYTGNYPHLWLFGNEKTLKNEPELLAFVRHLGSVRLKLILKNWACYGGRTRDAKLLAVYSPKMLLQTLYHLSLVDYCLARGSVPETTAQLGMLHHLPGKYRDMFDDLVAKRNAEQRLQTSEENPTRSTEEENTLRTYSDVVQEYREEIWTKIEGMPEPGERLDLLKNIVDYFLYDISLPSPGR